MTTYNTGNPVGPNGSTDPRDLYDNAQNLDFAVNSLTQAIWLDRLGVSRKTWFGMEQEFNQVLSDLNDRADDVIAGIGFQQAGDFNVGITLDSRGQILLFEGQWYQYVGTLPHTTTTNDPNTDGGIYSVSNPGGLWVNVGTDLSLRTELRQDNGALLVGGAVQTYETVADMVADTDLEADTVISWMGYAEANDGGGGIGRVKAGAVVEDGGSLFNLANGLHVEAFLNDKSVSCRKFGILPSINDNSAQLNKWRDYCIANKKQMHLVSGEYETHAVFDLGFFGVDISGDGRHNSVLYFPTEAGTRCIRLQASTYTMGMALRDFTIKGNPTTTSHLLIDNCHHLDIKNINTREGSPFACFSFDIPFSVASRFDTIICSTGEQPMQSRLYVGLRYGTPTGPYRATDCTFINPIIEGTIGDGIFINSGDSATFVGGTSENHDGNGVTISQSSRMNTFIGMGFENRGFADVNDAGTSSKFINCYSSRKFYAAAGARFGVIDGGIWERVEISPGADHYRVDNIDVKYWTSIGDPLPEGGGYFDASQTTTTGRVFDMVTSTLYYPIKPVVPIAPTVSPFIFQNTTGLPITLSYNGDISSAFLRLGGSNVLQLFNAGTILLQPDEGITISFSGTPTMGYKLNNIAM